MRRRLAALVLALPLLAFGCRPIGGPDNGGNTAPNANAGTNDVGTPVTNSSASSQRPTQEEALATLARTFTERYGSYANQSNFANLEYSTGFMTDAFAASTLASVAAQRSSAGKAATYYAVTVRSMTVTTDVFDAAAGLARFSVLVRKETAIETPGNTVATQDTLVVTMQQESGAWKVASAVWKGASQ